MRGVERCEEASQPSIQGPRPASTVMVRSSNVTTQTNSDLVWTGGENWSRPESEGCLGRPDPPGGRLGLPRHSNAYTHDDVLLRLRLWFFRTVPFLDRWAEAAPACCGTCPTCMGTVASGATLTWLGSLRRDED